MPKPFRTCCFSFLSLRFSLRVLPDFFDAIFRGDLSAIPTPSLGGMLLLDRIRRGPKCPKKKATVPGGSGKKLKGCGRRGLILGPSRRANAEPGPSPGVWEESLAYKETGPMKLRNRSANLGSVMRMRAKVAGSALALTMAALGRGLMATAGLGWFGQPRPLIDAEVTMT
jgi:hypothetical protein